MNAVKVISGYSGGYGFKLVCVCNGQSKTFQTANYRSLDMISLLFVGVSIVLFFQTFILVETAYLFFLGRLTDQGYTIYQTHSHLTSAGLGLTATCLSLFAGCWIIFPIRRWHACEHKLVNLINNKKELTLDSLREASVYASGCGSQVCIFTGILGFMICCLVVIIPPVRLTIWLIFWVLCFADTLLLMKFFHLTPILRLFQVTFLTKEPLPQQYEETLVCALKIHQWRECLEPDPDRMRKLAGGIETS